MEGERFDTESEKENRRRGEKVKGEEAVVEKTRRLKEDGWRKGLRRKFRRRNWSR